MPLVVFATEGETERAYLKALLTNRYGGVAFKFVSSRNRSSLINLVDSIRCEEKDEAPSGVAGAWIVCDRDENAPHRAKLEKWLDESERHHAAISHPCLEYWFLLHLCENPSSASAQKAVKELEKAWRWGEYKKGGQAPPELIGATDEAVRRALQRRQSLGDDADAWNSSQWTDMPKLIAWLDELDPGEARH